MPKLLENFVSIIGCTRSQDRNADNDHNIERFVLLVISLLLLQIFDAIETLHTVYNLLL